MESAARGRGRTGQGRIHAWLKKNGARSSAAVAQAAVEAAKNQHTTVPAQHIRELIVAALAREGITLDIELAELDVLISEKVSEHRHAQTLLSMPGFGPELRIGCRRRRTRPCAPGLRPHHW